jgi:hypothetical protein
MSVARHLSKHKFQFFTCNHASQHKAFINLRVQEDDQHPLNEVQKRLYQERKREGLWWHVTVGVHLSKAKVVRSWVRRRLQNAFVEELRERDVEQDGRLILDKGKAIGRHGIPTEFMKEHGHVSLVGSVRLHAQPSVITAKYTDIRLETGAVVDALLQGLKHDLRITDRRQDLKLQGLMQPQKRQRPTKNVVRHIDGPGRRPRVEL